MRFDSATICTALLCALALASCKTDDTGAPTSSTEQQQGSTASAEAAADEPDSPPTDEEAEGAARADTEARPTDDASTDDAEYPVRAYDQAPYVEEFLKVELYWNDDKAMLSPCMTPAADARCKRNGPTVDKGDQIKWEESRIRVKPRILTAKKEVTFRSGGKEIALQPGDELALYVYQGEGTCAVAMGEVYDKSIACPRAADFDNYPESKGGTAQTLQPDVVEWWVKLDDGWIKVDEDRMRVEIKSTEP